MAVPPELRERIAAVRNVRARRLLELIVEHGEVTTEQLREQYGYDHPPRAKRDAIDLGFAVVSRNVRSRNGSRTISAYSLDLDASFTEGRGGRRQFPKAFRDELLAVAGGRCAMCGGRIPSRALQIDHRVPYEIGGEDAQLRREDFQMLCGSCNRAKSWTCETECPNWAARDPGVCRTCLWASPDDYEHVATRRRRQVTLTWDDEDVARYDALRARARAADLPQFLRGLLDREQPL
jgi:5-methylcytosine-specific restriction endonuclease McrA